ncbi:MAG: TIGR01777 family oxidoreductase, partial [Bacteroidota bacterium]|nr:TIGR01777 family oxidoreductase [Bacteroidota bacterium]
MERKIVITGGTGFIGNYLTNQFKKMGYDVLVISRSKGDVQWNDLPGTVAALENAGVVINLAGKSVNCRYNEKNKTAILQSRTETTQMIGEAIGKCRNPPSLWINSSTATIYRHAEDRPMTEENGEIGKGFSVDVATLWEKTFFDFQLKQTRQIALRMAIVLGKNGGVIKPFLNLVRFGLGGKQGNGKQMFSWIHIADVFNIIVFVMEHKELAGIYNCSAPNPITNEVLMQTFRGKTHTQIG